MNEPVAIVKKITIGGIDNFPIEQFVRLKEGTLLYTHPVNPYQSITNTKIEPTVVSYTHPVKELTLTDEEKTELENALKVCEYKYFGSYPLSEKQWEAFEVLEKHAKAILRKSQE